MRCIRLISIVLSLFTIHSFGSIYTYDSQNDIVSIEYAKKIADLKCREFFGKMDYFDCETYFDETNLPSVYAFIYNIRYKNPEILATKESLKNNQQYVAEEIIQLLYSVKIETNLDKRTIKNYKEKIKQCLNDLNKKNTYCSIYISASKSHMPVIEWRSGLPESYLGLPILLSKIRHEQNKIPKAHRIYYLGPLDVFASLQIGEEIQFYDLGLQLQKIDTDISTRYNFRRYIQFANEKNLNSRQNQNFVNFSNRKVRIESEWDYWETLMRDGVHCNPERVLASKQLSWVPDFNQLEFSYIIHTGSCSVMAFADAMGFYDNIGFWNIVDYASRAGEDTNPLGGFDNSEAVEDFLISICDALNYDRVNGGLASFDRGVLKECFENFTNSTLFGNNLSFSVDEDWDIPCLYSTIQNQINNNQILNLYITNYSWNSGDGPYPSQRAHNVVVKGYDTTWGGWSQPITVYTNGDGFNYGDIWWDYADLENKMTWEIHSGGEPGTQLGSPVLTSPYIGQVITNTSRPSFNWENISGAINYRIQIDDNQFFDDCFEYETTNSEYSMQRDLFDGTYFWRVIAQNISGNWCVFSDPWMFRIAVYQVPTINTQNATEISQFSARVYGSVNPNGLATSVWFQWGPTTSYGNTTSSQSMGSGTSTVSFNQVISGLQMGTTYHYRAVAQNAGGIAYGDDRTFTTVMGTGNITATASPNPVAPNLPTTISVTVRNGLGQPVGAGKTVTFSTTHPGSFQGNGASSSSSPSSVLTDANGQTWIWFASWATGTAQMTISSEDSSTVIPITIQTPPPGSYNIQIAISFDDAGPDFTRYTVEAFVTDASTGNPAVGVNVFFATTFGTFNDTSDFTNAYGKAEQDLTITSSGQVTVTVQAGSSQQSTTFYGQVGDEPAPTMLPEAQLSTEENISGLAVTPDGSRFAVGTYGHSGTLRCYSNDTGNWSQAWYKRAGSGDLADLDIEGAVDINADGTKVLVATDDGTKVFAVATGTKQTLSKNRYSILSHWYGNYCFDTDDTRLIRVSASFVDTTIFTLPSGHLFDWKGDLDYTSANGGMVAVGTDSGHLYVRSTSGASIFSDLSGNDAYCYGVAFSSDGTKLAAAFLEDDTIKVYNTSGWSSQLINLRNPSSVCFLDNDTKLAIGGDGKVVIYSLGVGGYTKFREASVSGVVYEMCWCQATQRLFVGTHVGQVYIFRPLFDDTIDPIINVSHPPNNYVTNDTSINTTGTVSDNDGVSAFTINGTGVTVGGDGSFAYTVPLNEGSNSIAYHAADRAGNTTDVTRTVTRIVDRTPPVISGVAVSPYTGEAGTIFTIQCTVVDGDTGVASVTATIKNSLGATVASLPMSVGGGGAYSCLFNSTGLPLGVYTVSITAVDSSPQANSRSLAGAAEFTLMAPAIALSTLALNPSCTQGNNAASQSFTVRNGGPGTLNYTITDDVSWLSCTPASGTSTGETDTITVAYSTTSLEVGPHTATITVTAAGASNSPQTVAVLLTVNQPTSRVIRVSGDLAFGKVTVGQSAQRTLTIFNDGEATLSVSAISYPLGFSGTWSGTIAAGGSRAVTVTFAPTAAQSYGGTITVNSDATGGTNTISCSGTGVTTTKIIRLVGNLAFGNVTVGQSTTRTLTIYNDGNSMLTVSSINYPSGFSGAWSGTIAAGGSRAVAVTFAPTAEQSYGGTVTVTSDATGGTNTISCSGAGVTTSTRIIRLEGDLAFGNVAVGSSAQRTLTILNDGDTALTVTSINHPPGFSGGWNGSIAAGGSRAVTVTFTPTVDQLYEGTIMVNSDATGGTGTITCSGTGKILSSERLFFPRLSYIPGSSTEGYGFVNFGDEDALVNFTAYDETGQAVATSGVMTWPAGQQQAYLAEGLLRLDRETHAWVEVETDSPTLAGFFLTQSTSHGFGMDGSEVITQATREGIIPRAVYSGEYNTEICVANPSASPVTVSISALSPDGFVNLGQHVLNPGGFLLRDLGTLLDGKLTFDGYLRLAATGEIAGNAIIRHADGAISSANLISVDQASHVLYSAHVTSLPGFYYSDVVLINPANEPATVRMTAYDATGNVIRTLEDIVLPMGESRLFHESDLGLTGQADGWLKVESSGAPILGYVTFGNPIDNHYESTLLFQNEGTTDAYFAQVANGNVYGVDYFTGIAIVNSNDASADVSISVHLSDGTLNGQVVYRRLAPGEKYIRLTEQIEGIGILAGQSSGYLHIKATQPVLSFALFGNDSLDFLSAVPARQCSESSGVTPSIVLSTDVLYPSCTQGENASNQSFRVRNGASGTLNYSINETCNWINSCSPTTGTSTGESDSITVRYNSADLSVGIYTATITISAAGASNSPQYIDVVLTVNTAPTPSIDLSHAALSPVATLGSNAPSQSFTVRNSGEGTLSYNVTDNENWLSCSPASGSSTGEADTITVSYSTAGLALGTYNATITVSAAGAPNSPQMIHVSLTIENPPMPVGVQNVLDNCTFAAQLTFPETTSWDANSIKQDPNYADGVVDAGYLIITGREFSDYQYPIDPPNDTQMIPSGIGLQYIFSPDGSIWVCTDAPLPQAFMTLFGFQSMVSSLSLWPGAGLNLSYADMQTLWDAGIRSGVDMHPKFLTLTQIGMWLYKDLANRGLIDNPLSNVDIFLQPEVYILNNTTRRVAIGLGRISTDCLHAGFRPEDYINRWWPKGYASSCGTASLGFTLNITNKGNEWFTWNSAYGDNSTIQTILWDGVVQAQHSNYGADVVYTTTATPLPTQVEMSHQNVWSGNLCDFIVILQADSLSFENLWENPVVGAVPQPLVFYLEPAMDLR